MKNVIAIPLALLLCSSCNLFDLVDPNINHADRCRQLADKKKYDDALEECVKADPERTDPEIQLEMGDIYLAKAGITLQVLSDVFFDTTHSTSLIIDLANSILAAGAVTEQKKLDSLNAVTAFDFSFNQFYGTLARLCYVTMLIAYTDNDGRGAGGEGNGIITPEDLCSASSCSVICTENSVNTKCDGMTREDAEAAAESLMRISSFLSELGLGNVDNTLENMLNTEVVDPTDPPNTTTIGELTGANQGDAVRRLFWQMAGE
ncbi:MAG: hypothetical protein JXA66_05460 [Oligoflexia bacterium]|nr:hypothetical protein [Oligoflexia bacterium]